MPISRTAEHGVRLEYSGYEKQGHVALVTIQRPEVLNALHPPAHRELGRVWDDFAADDELWVAILTGTGDRAFCAGADVKYAKSHPGEPYWVFHGGSNGFGGLTDRPTLYKPVIAAVNGLAIGGGMELALACDLIVAADHAEFAMPEPRIGFTSGFGGLERVIRQIPEKWAMELILLGNRVSAADALRMGFVNRVVPREDLLEVARGLAEQVLLSSPLATRANKQAAMRARDVPLEVASNRIYDQMIKLWESEDHVEGPRAFVEKRPPRWKGR